MASCLQTSWSDRQTMGRILYLDCFSGASGDMLIGALLDAGLPFDTLRTALGSLALDGECTVSVERVSRSGIAATKFTVGETTGDVAGTHRHRHLPGITKLVERSALSDSSKQRANRLFGRLAETEAAIHQMPVEQVHLHEVGALDSIVDIVGGVFAVEWFGADRIVASPINVGSGTVMCEHGTLPVPAPATAAMVLGVPVYAAGPSGELLTPTGALLVTEFAGEYGALPRMRIETIGYGAGTRDPAGHPNVLRVLVGEEIDDGGWERVAVVECEIDDMNPQIFGVLMDRLYAEGAVEVFYTAGPDEEEPAGHACHRSRAAGPSRVSLRDPVPRVDDDRSAPQRGDPRDAAARAAAGVDPLRRGAVQGGAAWCGRGQRRAGIRRVRAAGRAARCVGQGGPRRCGQGVSGCWHPRVLPCPGEVMARFYLTTAIDYVNSRPHLGTAYEKVTADVIARYRRLCGLSTYFLMGNDEHSQNVYQRAVDLGLEPRAFCDEMEQVFRRVWTKLDVSFDDFIRTTEERHRLAVTTLVQRIADAGDLYEGEYEGWYCVSCEAFKQDKDLVDGDCAVHQTRPQWIQGEEPLLPLVELSRPAPPALRCEPDVSAA